TGRALGLHCVMSAERRADIPAALSSTLQPTLMLRQAETEYPNAAVARLLSNAPPGRGIYDGREVQIALIAGQPTLAAQSQRITEVALQQEALGWSRQAEIAVLPTQVSWQ